MTRLLIPANIPTLYHFQTTQGVNHFLNVIQVVFYHFLFYTLYYYSILDHQNLKLLYETQELRQIEKYQGVNKGEKNVHVEETVRSEGGGTWTGSRRTQNELEMMMLRNLWISFEVLFSTFFCRRYTVGGFSVDVMFSIFSVDVMLLMVMLSNLSFQYFLLTL